MLDRRYKITKYLSKGAFGRTFLARDTRRPNHPICVVKQLELRHSNPDYLRQAIELFEREAITLEKLGKHSQIPTLLAHFEIDGEFYLIEEYIEGKTLAEELVEEVTKSEKQVISIVNELLEILTFVHKNNIIHRDIKPSNIIRSQQDNKLVLIDFGAVKEISTLQNPGTIIGTPGYAAPEQWEGKPSFSSDIYAVGLIGIQALTGIRPNDFSIEDEKEIIWGEQISVSRKFTAILTKMVQKNQSNRYSTADEVIKDIKNIKEGKTIILPFKKLLFSSLAIMTTISLFLWLKPIINKESENTLPLNGMAIDGNLEPDNICQDVLSAKDKYCHKYTFRGEQGQEITLKMNSNEFDPFLVLYKPDSNKLTQNNDSYPRNRNAKIEAKLPNDGTYTVITTTNEPGESGKYTVRAIIKSFNNFD